MGNTLTHLWFAAIICVLFSCSEEMKVPSEPMSHVEIPKFHPQVKFNMVVNNLFNEDHIVKKKQQFTDLLQGYPVAKPVWVQLNSLMKKQFDFRRVVAGRPYSLFIKPDSVCSLQALVYEINLAEYVIFHFEDSLRLEYCQKEIVTTEKILSGVIDNNLSEAISSQGVSHELTNRIVDILGWQIDFYQLQKGDQFKIAYTEKSVEGKAFGIVQVLGASFKHRGKDFWAIPFNQGEGLDYFDLSGNSIRRAFLKYPIEFTHISSRYSRNRFHPVLKVNRPHLGTDLAAATGTPIRSVGNGIVVEAGYNSGSGNYVKIKHNGTYTTGYLHMSKIGAGIKKGVAVEQAQVIGYVGSTGWATGPHLCYRFWKNGIQVDALRVLIPPAKPVREEAKESYECAMIEALEKLKTLPNPVQNALAIR
jgi:murein DD-endopeptidase MepM/ murein hydrolase activator NlpD